MENEYLLIPKIKKSEEGSQNKGSRALYCFESLSFGTWSTHPVATNHPPPPNNPSSSFFRHLSTADNKKLETMLFCRLGLSTSLPLWASLTLKTTFDNIRILCWKYEPGGGRGRANDISSLKGKENRERERERRIHFVIFVLYLKTI